MLPCSKGGPGFPVKLRNYITRDDPFLHSSSDRFVQRVTSELLDCIPINRPVPHIVYLQHRFVELRFLPSG
jgi:hypothetical protein